MARAVKAHTARARRAATAMVIGPDMKALVTKVGAMMDRAEMHGPNVDRTALRIALPHAQAPVPNRPADTIPLPSSTVLRGPNARRTLSVRIAMEHAARLRAGTSRVTAGSVPVRLAATS